MVGVKPHHYVISDLHLGHTKILEYTRPRFKSIQKHDDFIINKLCELKGNDYLWILGDIAFKKDGIRRLAEVPCQKVLVAGNHDIYKAAVYLKVFNKILGCAELRYGDHNIIFTHIPIHPDSRWDLNVHGHLHERHVYDGLNPDNRYYNVCCERIDYTPLKIEDILKEKAFTPPVEKSESAIKGIVIPQIVTTALGDESGSYSV